MRFILSLAFALALLGPSVRAAVCKTSNWRVKPTQAQLLGVWPREALRRGQDGKALIACKVSVQGALHDCAVVSEDPPNTGFGGAALALTPQFLMTPFTCDGKPFESDVRIPIHFTGLTGLPPTGSILPLPASSLGHSVIARVPWMDAPTYAQVLAAYPDKARRTHVGGHVALNCRFDGGGRLAGCEVLSENPAGAGFGKGAKTLAKAFLAPRTDANGLSLKDDTTVVAFTFAPEMLDGQSPVIGKPQWTRVPEAVDVAAGFPAAATAANITVGHVVMGCQVGVGGKLTDCAVTRQSPDGLGFDKAALALSAVFQVTV